MSYVNPKMNDDGLPITDAINDILGKYCSALREIERLKKDAERGQALSTSHGSRFRIEERSGIVAIYDTYHPEYADTPGCQADYPWVVCSWRGRYVTPPDPECLNGCGHWTVEKRWIEKARQTCDLLNSLSPNNEMRDGGAEPQAKE